MLMNPINIFEILSNQLIMVYRLYKILTFYFRKKEQHQIEFKQFLAFVLIEIIIIYPSDHNDANFHTIFIQSAWENMVKMTKR